jgi:hypothetical protein
MSQFSLGVSGIKEDTAKKIELYARDTGSPFYPGPGMDALVAYAAGQDHNSTLYNRLTDNKNHYYSFLYAALFTKEIEAQWTGEGYDITARPDVTVTLFNIGFTASKPKDTPQMGGAAITLGSKTYSFGELGALFYKSDELATIFPRP